MQRRSFIRTLGVAGAGATASLALHSPAIAQTRPKVNWRLVSGFPKQLDTIFGAAHVFADSVREVTDGQFDIQVHAPGEIVESLGELDAVQNGLIDMAHTASYYFVDKDPTFAFGTGLPFGLNQRMTNAWLYEGDGMQLLEAFYSEYNIISFPAGNTGAQMGGWFRKEINSLEDMQGLKIRISGLGAQILKKIGAVPQFLAGGDIYEALKEGTIDAAEFVGPYDDARLGFNKVANYYYYPGWWEGGVALMNMINLQSWDALPNPYKAAIRSASALANVTMMARYDTLNPPTLRKLVAEGTILRPYTHDILEACFVASEAIYEEISAKNARFKLILDSYMEYRREAYMWFQRSEYSQDTFLMMQRRGGRL